MFLYITQQNDRAYTLEKSEVGFFILMECLIWQITIFSQKIINLESLEEKKSVEIIFIKIQGYNKQLQMEDGSLHYA